MAEGVPGSYPTTTKAYAWIAGLIAVAALSSAVAGLHGSRAGRAARATVRGAADLTLRVTPTVLDIGTVPQRAVVVRNVQITNSSGTYLRISARAT